MKDLLCAALAYFGTAFGVGFALGLVRVPLLVPLLVPRLGERTAELLELPLMLVACAFLARWVLRRFRVPAQPLPRAVVGAVALALMLGAEALVVVALRGQSLARYAAERDPIAGSAYLLALLIFAALPALLGIAEQRRGSR